MAIQRTMGHYNGAEVSRYVDDLSEHYAWRMTASKSDLSLLDRIYDFSVLFSDMLFEENGIYKTDDGEILNLQPEELHYFTYQWIKTSVCPLPSGCAGIFIDHVSNKSTNSDEADGFISRLVAKNDYLAHLVISPQYANDDAVLLHEMIHLHETVLEDFPLYYHDMLLYWLHRKLSKSIIDLDERIKSFSCLALQQEITAYGGCHDILFLLKSYDLDLKMGYPLGRVLAYRVPNFPIV